MVSWSSLRAARAFINHCRNPPQPQNYIVPQCKGLNLTPVRYCKSKGGVFYISPSTFQWNKFKDLVHFYALLGLIPVLGIILYTNIFIGPATLKPIPEGYRPKHWEYYSHPITRFIARYCRPSPQKSYEKMCFLLFYEQEFNLVKEVERKVKYLISQRRDYQAWFYSPPLTRYARKNARLAERTELWRDLEIPEDKLN